MKNPSIFIAYSHKDERWLERLATHLSSLKYQGILDMWDDRRITAGGESYRELRKAMDSASLGILLVSANFLTSEYFLHEEPARLIEKRARDGLRIIPVIVSSCAWQTLGWFQRMQVQPYGGRPLAAFPKNKIDAQLAKIVKVISSLLDPSSRPVATGENPPIDTDRISVGHLPVTGSDLFGREQELSLLDDAWSDPNTKILSLVAYGGVGKSALVNHWLWRMGKDHYRGAEWVYAWSFYRQGASELRASADLFIESALSWFGDSDPNKGSPWEKGRRLALLIGSHRTLLILDGLEPLQTREGNLKDVGLRELLLSLAHQNQGLCVITTRLPINDLMHLRTARRLDLEHLSPEAGAQILRAQGVRGEEVQLRNAAEDLGGHALALTLVGSHLMSVYGGELRHIDDVANYGGDRRSLGAIKGVIGSYERLLGDSPELAVMRLLGLFDRPADNGALAALRAAPAIPNLTETLQGLGEDGWVRVLVRLRHLHLLAPRDPSQPDLLDTHPLIREHFGRQLRQENLNAWREGHNRIYEHLIKSSNLFISNFSDLTPLYEAVAHGCLAGRHRDALDKVYYQRILQSKRFGAGYFGALEADLGALSGFFVEPWHRPVEGLSEADRGFVFNAAGFALRATGRLSEAIHPMRAGLISDLAREDWKNASIAVGNLSEVFLILGELTEALAYAQNYLEIADRSGDVTQQIALRSVLADILHQEGRLSEAEDVFLSAEKMHKSQQPDYPLLYSIQGFKFCDLLLTRSRYQDVLYRAQQTVEWASQNALSPLAVALDYVTIGRALLLQFEQQGLTSLNQAYSYLERALEGLRVAGVQEFLVHGLIGRADLRRLTGDLSEARVDLEEARSIVERSGMRLLHINCLLAFARLYLFSGDKKEAEKSLSVAQHMIHTLGCHRWDFEVANVGARL